MGNHDRRSRRVDQTLDRHDSPAVVEESHLRIGLPGGQLRFVRSSRWRPARRPGRSSGKIGAPEIAPIGRDRLCSMRARLLIALVWAAQWALAADGSWKAYLGGPGSEQFSSLTQINKTNVNQLQVAWTYATGEKGNY